MSHKESDTAVLPIRCGIVLAGGDGQRLRPFVHRLKGVNLPKQYVNFFGSRSMIEMTFERTEKLLLPDHLFTVVNRDHLQFSEVKRQLSSRSRGTVVVQPQNKETGPGLLLPLIYLYKRYPKSTVAVFPSDHFVVEEDLLMSHVDLAFRVVEWNPSRLVLLGVEPSEAETDYGYILPTQRAETLTPLQVREVARFVEKPMLTSVRKLILDGGLWNTMIMVFKAKTLLNVVRRVSPRLFRLFGLICQAIGTTVEKDVVEQAYKNMQSVNFSRGLLEAVSLHRPSPLWVLPVRGVHWSDWGSEDRITSELQKLGRRDNSKECQQVALEQGGLVSD